MKKKMLEKLFAGTMAAMMVLGSTAMAFAADPSFTYPGPGEVPNNPADNGLSTQVVYSASAQASDYTVTVPEKLIITGSVAPNVYTSGDETKAVTIKGYSTKAVTVDVANTNKLITMKTAAGNQTLNAKATFTALTLPATVSGAEATQTGNVSAEWDSVVPTIDTWTGSITYSITVAA